MKGAVVMVEGIDKYVNTTDRGEYWRLLLPGSYTVRAQSGGGKFSEPLQGLETLKRF